MRELLQVYAHLEDKLTERHLLIPSELIESAAIRARIVHRLDRRNAQQLRGFGFRELRFERVLTDLALEIPLLPFRQVLIVLIENALQPYAVEPCRLPQLRA